VFSYKYLKKSASHADGSTGLGKGTEGKFSPEEQSAVDQAHVIVENNTYVSFNRAVMDKVVYYARVYTKPKLYDDTCVKLEDNTYGVIEKIVSIPGHDSLWAFIKLIRLSLLDGHWVTHIKNRASNTFDSLKLVKLISVSHKCIFIENLAESGRSFICEIPNRYERD